VVSFAFLELEPFILAFFNKKNLLETMVSFSFLFLLTGG
jgi:hypothetical protein